MSIVPTFSDREALERFKESESELRAMAQIAQMTKEEFVQKYAFGSFFNGDIRQARRVYETAVAVNARNALIWANIKDTVASPFYRSTLFNNIPQEFIKNLENIPGYQRLFGSLDHIEVDHDRSVFSAAAYFVDLLRFIDDFVRDSRNQKDQAFLLENDGGRRRRPDLYNFRLDPQNTNELIPYIDLVNEVLEAIVRTEDEPDAYKILDAVDFPLSLPFNRSLIEVREYLKQLGTSLYAIYQAYKRLQIDNAADLARHIDREFMELSPREYALMGDEAADLHTIERLYGTAYELTESSWANVPLSAEAKDRLRVATGRPVPERDDFQAMLTRLAGRLSPTDKAIADEIINHAEELTDQSYNRYDLARLSSLTVFLQQTGLDRKQVNELLYQDLDGSEVNAGLSRLFFINDVEDGLGPLMLQDGPDGPGGFDEQLVNLSYAKLARIYRFLKLARKLGWTFTDLDLALRSLHEPYVAGKMLEFDGIDDYVACRNVTNLDLTALTIEAWVNPGNQGNNVILCKGKESDWQIHFLFLIDPDGKLAFYDNGSKQFVTGQSALPGGTFSHVAVTVDNQGNVKFYINGNLDGDPANPITLSQLIQPVGTDLDIGRNLNDAYFSGIITELRLWSGARSQVAIAGSRYQRFTGREVGLVGYWSLSENRWDKLFDQTPNRNDGVMGGEGFVTQPIWVQRDLVLDATPEPVARTGYQFNGIDQYLSARRVTGIDLAALTVEAWVKWDKSAEYEIVAKGDEATGQAQFRLWIDSNAHLAFASATWGNYASTRSLKAGVLTHVAIALPVQSQILALSEQYFIRIYIDGIPEEFELTVTAPQLEGDTLTVGRRLKPDYAYYQGLLKELRIWNTVRTQDQILLHMVRTVEAREPGLIGYWRLNAIEDGQARDLSYNGTHLFLGGMQEDYMPERVPADWLLPDLPIATRGTALHFDDQNDRVIIQNAENRGPGAYDQLTIALWFNATDVSTDREQIIFTQGDAEDGLVIYISQGTLSVVAWSDNYEGTAFQKAMFKTNAITSGTWHHIAVTKDETVALDFVRYMAYLDGQLFGQSDEQFRLCPVEPAFLGNPGKDTVTWTEKLGKHFGSTEAQTGATYPYYFDGLLTDFRMWRVVKTLQELATIRFIAPVEVEPDLVVYLPLTQGSKEVQDSLPDWQDVSMYPLLLKPLKRKALRFDGVLRYASEEKVPGLDTTPYTLEVWIMPARNQAQKLGGPVLRLFTAQAGQPAFQLAVNEEARVVVTSLTASGTLVPLIGTATLPADKFTHVAVSFDGNGTARLYVNGQEDGTLNGLEALNVSEIGLEVGRGIDATTTTSPVNYFAGQLRDLRLWKVARTREQIAANRYEQPELTDDLIGYWSFDEDAGGTLTDHSVGSLNQLRLGGIKAARRPVINDPSVVFVLPEIWDFPLEPEGITLTDDPGLFDLAALKLDGNSNYVEIPDGQVPPLDEATFEVWVKPDKLIGEATLWDQPNNAVKLAWLDNRLELSVAGNDPQQQTFDFGFDVNEWVHIALVYSRTDQNAQLYINEHLIADDKTTYKVANALAISAALVGQNGNKLGNLRGLIKELRWWSVARTPEQIQTYLFRRLTGDEDNLVIYLPYNEEASLEHALAWVSPDLLDSSLGQGFWNNNRLTAVFNGKDGPVYWSDSTGEQTDVCQRRTVEVWFKADDKDIASRKQVIYSEGDDKHGLSIYLFDGQLYFGGYNLLDDTKDWGHWAGTWLSTNRIHSGKWHHAALVLDGRDEVRAGSLQAFLDGKFVAAGNGAQLAQCSSNLALGGISGRILFHDDLPDGVVPQQASASFLQGQILDLRVWNTARSPHQLQLYRYRQLTGQESNLELWWQFEQVKEGQTPDLSIYGHVGQLVSSVQIQPIDTSPAPAPAEDILTGLAKIKRLVDKYQLPMNQLTSLWYEIQHTGKANGQPLFDTIFNPKGSVFPAWSFHMDAPIRWDMTGATDQILSRQIRSRLMGALRVSYDNLNNLVSILSGADETIIELDSAYLTNLYRLARLPGLFGLNVTEFTNLLKMMGLAKVDSLDRFALVSERVDWMQQLGINVFQLNFLSTDQQSDKVTFPYNDSSIRDLADSLRRQSSEFLAQETSFVTSEISALQSLGLFKLLRSLGDIDQIGAVEPTYAPPLHFHKLFFLGDTNASPDATELRLNLTEVAFATLTQDQLDTLKTKHIIDDNGLVLDEHGQGILLDPDPVKANFTDTRLQPLFTNVDAAMLSTIREALERGLKIQTDVANKLIGMRDALAAAALAGLSSLVSAPPDRTLVVAQHLATNMTLKQFFVIMVGIGMDANHKDLLPIPDMLTVRPTGYLYRLSKILYLAGQFNLTLDETVALIEHPQYFTVKNILQPDISDLTSLYLFTTLKSAFNDTAGKLLKVFGTDGKGSAAVTAIQDLTGWEARQIEELMAYFGNELAYNRVAGLDRLRVIFEITTAMHVDVEFVTQLANTGALSIDFYARQSANLLEVLRSQYDDEQWPQVFRPVHDRMAVQIRDVLLARAMLNISSDFAGRRNPDALSEYLLLDLQTGSEVDTSRVVQATASLQLYVQRCMLNLERGIDPASVPTDQWEWMKNYRVWEANRKVFLYPENYIEPELRDNKTPFFQELEQDLIQGEIDQDLVEKAYTNYLNKFAEVANLKIVGSHYHAADAAEVNDGLKGKNVLYLLGRTRTQPYVYYLRQYIEGEQWIPWQKITITFNADSATPVYAFNRLFVFWVEFMKTTEARDTGEMVQVGNSSLSKQENVDVFKATVKYTYQNLAKEWVQPQVFIDLGRNLEKNEVVLQEWQRVYLQRFLEFFPSSAPSEVAVNDSNVTVLQIEANPQINGETELKLTVPSMAMDKLTWSFWANFINNSVQGFTSIQPPGAQSLRLVYYNNSSIPGLVEPDNDFLIDVTSNISPAPGAPDVQAARAERDEARENLAVLMADDPAFGQLQNAQGQLDAAENSYQDALIAVPEPSHLDALKSIRDSARSELASLEAQTRVQDTQLTTAQNNRDAARAAYQNAQAADPTAANLGTLQQAWNDADGKLQTLQKKQAAQDKLSQAEQVYQSAVDAIKWQTTDLTLAVHSGSGRSATEAKLLYGSWQHIAVTMDYDPVTNAYSVQLFVNGTPQGPQVQCAANVFTPGQELTIGQQARDVLGKFEPGKGIPEQYTTQLSEFQLWKQARPAAQIEGDRFKRYATNLLVLGVFSIPLDRRASSAELNLQPSNPALNLQRSTTPRPPIERERILLLWGKDVRRCIHNTLETDKSLNLVLEDPNTIPAVNYVASQASSVVLKASSLRIQARALHEPARSVVSAMYANLHDSLASDPFLLDLMLGISNTSAALDAVSTLYSLASVDERWATAYDRSSGQSSGLTLQGPNDVSTLPGPNLSILRAMAIDILTDIQAGITDPLSSYSLDLSLNQLYVQATNKLSIHAYAVDIFGMLTPPLNRFTPELRRFIVAAANRAYSLTEPEAQQFQAEIAGLSAFGVANIQTNQPDRLKAFLKSSFGVESVSIPQPLPAKDSSNPKVLLANVLSDDATFMEVNNQPGWYILDTGDEQFLIKTIGKQPLKSAKDRIQFFYGASTNEGSPQPLTIRFAVDDALVARDNNPLTDFHFEFERLSTYAIHDMSLSLFAGGIDSLLSLDSQMLPEIDFQKQYQAGMLVTPPDFDRATNTTRTGIDFDGPDGLYYREIFFHIPFLIANKLNANQKFAEAQKWHHYIFDPTTSEPAGIASNPNDRYWRFRPFRDLSLETLRQMLSNKDALAEYRDHPFDPHAIARLRLNAYQKAIVMKYINNLLDWGDNLFAQDSREAIGEAAQLYILAYNLLGQRPQSKAVKDFREVGTYDDIIAANKDGLPDFLTELDGHLPAPAGNGALGFTPINTIITDFGVIENDVFIGYWDRVEDRLFKIRHSLNLQGVFRQLALFQPPINPMALVSAIAGGRDLSSVLSDLNVVVPNYRFLFLMDKAKEMASTVNDLGAALLDALEKRDAEGLARLQNSQEKLILDLTTAIRQNELDTAKKTVDSLNQSKAILDAKKAYYDGLLNAGLNAAENAFFAMKNAATGLKVGEAVAKIVTEGLKAAPTAITGLEGIGGSPVADVEISGDEVGAVFGAIAEGLAAAGEALDLQADISEKRGEFDRRQAEWQFESNNAQNEITEITTQIAIAQLQSSIAEQALAIHMKTIEQNQEIADFYRSKFTSQDLYNWMVSQLSGLYFQAYKLAYDYAKSTEKALQLERLTSNTFISFGHWDSLKNGLLSGSSLLLELNRMEKFYLDQNRRSYEIEKNISMQKSMPDALRSLLSRGTADFQLTEKLFDLDYFGHYGRTIKSIAISVNTSTPIDPYDSVHATLIQLGSKTILAPDINAVLYLLGVAGANQPDSSVLRVNWRANQQIAISKVDADTGMFADLDFFFDDRYFPFEGTGAISTWRLEMPKETNRFDFNSITDVIITIKYTALADSGAFKQAVAKEMSNLKNG